MVSISISNVLNISSRDEATGKHLIVNAIISGILASSAGIFAKFGVSPYSIGKKLNPSSWNIRSQHYYIQLI